METHLVTGAAGFIGSHVCDRLVAEGSRVIGIDDLSHGSADNLRAVADSPMFHFEAVDVRGTALAEIVQRHRPGVVVHCAAQAGVRPSLEDPLFDTKVNVVGLVNLLEAASTWGVRKVVFASSGGTIYGEPRQLPVPEAARHGSRPDSPYGISKKVSEHYLHFYRRHRGVDYVALALANVYGPRQDPHGEAGVVSIFGSAMLDGRAVTIFGDGEQTRDYVYVDDVAEAFLLACERGSGELLNIGTGVETSVNEIHRLIAEATGSGVEPRYGPARPGEIARIALDSSRARDVLGWEARVPLGEGLRRTVAFLRGATDIAPNVASASSG